MRLLKRVTYLAVLLCAFLGEAHGGDYMATSGDGAGVDKLAAIKRAYSNMVGDVVRKIAGDQASSTGVVGKVFTAKLAEDPETFISTYFQDEVQDCERKQQQVSCWVEATAKLFEFRPAVEKALIDLRQGKERIGSYRMAVRRDPEEELASRLADAIQSRLVKYGHDVELLDRGVDVGKKGNLCNQYQTQLDQLEKGGDYPKAKAQIKALLATCEKNADISRVIDIHMPTIKMMDYNSRMRSRKGTLRMNVEVRNGETGRVDMNVNDTPVKSAGWGENADDAKEDLLDNLLQQAADDILKSLNDSLAQAAQKTQYNNSKISKYEAEFLYIYTLQLDGVSQDVSSDRKKRKMVRRVIENLGAKAKLDTRYTEKYKTVYRFGINKEVDEENFLDDLYEAAEQKGYQDFRARWDGEKTIVTSFGGN